MPQLEPRYIAFISYSRKNNPLDDPGDGHRRWADWLKETIEDYPIPRVCIGQEKPPWGPVPNKMPPVFLDRKGMSRGSVLEENLTEALDRSEFLVVICSPASAASPYVALEVRRFIETNRASQIIPVVVDGGADPADFLPEPLRELERTTRTGSLLYHDLRPPEAADLRDRAGQPDRQGWTSTEPFRKAMETLDKLSPRRIRELESAYKTQLGDFRFRLVADLLGLTQSELANEEANRMKAVNAQQRRWLMITIGLGLVAVVMAILMAMSRQKAVRAEDTAKQEQQKAEEQRRKAEEEKRRAQRLYQMVGDAHSQTGTLVAGILTDVKRPDEQGKPKEASQILAEAELKVNEFFKEIEPAGMSADSRYMRALVFNEKGRIDLLTGKLEDAKKNFENGLRLRKELEESDPTELLYRRNVGINEDHLGDFWQAQADAWVAMGARDKEELKAMSKKVRDAFTKATTAYGRGLVIAEEVAAQERTDQAVYDLSISYFKKAEALHGSGDAVAAINTLEEGRKAALHAARSELDYPKWRAQYGNYCYLLAAMYAKNDQPEMAEAQAKAAQAEFAELEKEGRLDSRSRQWQEDVNALLEDLKP